MHSVSLRSDTDAQLMLPLREARSFRQHSVLRSDTVRVELKNVTRSCPLFVDGFVTQERDSRPL